MDLGLKLLKKKKLFRVIMVKMKILQNKQKYNQKLKANK